MSDKTYIPENETVPASQIGATLEALASTIAARRDADESSYTYRLLTDEADTVLKKVMQEADEVALAAKDVESWACSSLAAAIAFENGRGTDVEPDTLAVELPDDYQAAIDHLRYEAADVVYHLMVVLERYGIGLDEFAAELNNRMTDAERPEGAIRLTEEHINRGK